MFRGGVSALWSLLAVVGVVTLPLVGQSVISTHSGLVHFFEGSVFLGGQPLEPHPGKFAAVPQGAELRTTQGRVEVLLTPGVFLRLGEGGAMRMIDNDLSHTRVELLAGSAVVDSAGSGPSTSVTLLYRDWSLRILDQGMYRIDADSARLWVLKGEVQVSAGVDQRRLSVEQGMYLRFAAVLVPDQSVDQPRDAFSAWADGRQQAIAADNAIASSTQDPASIPDPAMVSAPNSGNRFTLPIYAQLAAAGLSAGLIAHAYFSNSPRRSSALLPSTQYGFTRLLSDAPSHSARSNGIRAVGLWRPFSARVQFHLAVPEHLVSRVRSQGIARR
jgi:hypothetical protein